MGCLCGLYVVMSADVLDVLVSRPVIPSNDAKHEYLNYRLSCQNSDHGLSPLMHDKSKRQRRSLQQI